MERYIGAAQTVVDLALPDVPETAQHFKTREMIFKVNPTGNANDGFDSRYVLSNFLTRAYRRPVTEEELLRAAEQYSEAIELGLSVEAAIKQVIQSTLISPKFLLRVEAGRQESAPIGFLIGS